MNSERSGKNKYDDRSTLVKTIAELSDYLYLNNAKAAINIIDELIPVCIDKTLEELRSPIIKFINQKIYRELKHAKRVSVLAGELANSLSYSHEVIKDIEIGGFMHDLGKLFIDETILYKEEYLSTEEWKTIQKHASIGASLLSMSQYSRFIPMAEQHHERWDGMGYPNGLSGSAIHFSARLISIVDAYDAMICNRSYQKCITPFLAMEEIYRCSGTQFDPDMAAVFINQFFEHSIQPDKHSRYYNNCDQFYNKKY
ncbi:HD-GYP domain-containing protein [Acetobacterium woodii]|uniref:HD-GYP domain-containing protein n=1 Tax=Acetobacterium woodii (strain ATCC 29683 / DSM 1030 / JCM 2381 / KCTC 1655 / WB1) TaxID=931626 RepID=H6LHY9_ACEWD|nr:HD domain-containing phosphohydrolase [Acetobacterium woodii]AFA48519.1 hypothetical protein Awo_c17390 [Acetobacterium woodii DSM 1030]